MKVRLIRLLNWAYLMVVVVGLPAITSLHFGGVHVTSVRAFRQLTLGFLGFAAVANWVLTRWPGGNRRVISSHVHWMWIHLCFLAVFALAFAGHLDFGWLKESLLWLRDRTRSVGP